MNSGTQRGKQQRASKGKCTKGGIGCLFTHSTTTTTWGGGTNGDTDLMNLKREAASARLFNWRSPHLLNESESIESAIKGPFLIIHRVLPNRTSMSLISRR
jgi:hypothetical protein